MLQVRLHPAALGAPGGAVAVQRGGGAAVAPAALLVRADLPKSAASARRPAVRLAAHRLRTAVRKMDSTERRHLLLAGRTNIPAAFQGT